MKCPKCGKDNVGYTPIKDGLCRYSDCGCPVPTMKQIAIEAGMHPEYPKEKRANA